MRLKSVTMVPRIRGLARDTVVALCARGIPILLLCLAASCTSQRTTGDVVARVGKLVLTDHDVAELAGKPYDSLTASERWLLVDGWTTQRLFELEGERRGFDNDPVMKEQLAALRGELFRSRLLHESPQAEPSDSAIALYYTAHREEFLRPADSYLIALYWAATQTTLEQFRGEFLNGDSSRILKREITAEGKWLAEAGELDADLVKELSQLKPGSFSRLRAAEDGYRMLRLVDVYPAGTVVDLEVVRSEIVGRMLIEAGQTKQDSLLEALKLRWPVEVLLGKEER